MRDSDLPHFQNYRKIISRRILCILLFASLMLSLLNFTSSSKEIVYRATINNKKQIALTFDDGPHPVRTPEILDILDKYGIKATFFLVGERLPYYEEEVIREVAEGHEIGYHSYDHTIQTTLSSEKITRDFEKTNQMLKDLTGAEFTVWRSPGGGYNQRVLNCIPLPHIYWWLDTKDWQTRNADKVYSAIINKSTDGSIILLHDLHKTSVEGSIKAMEDMIEGDYEFLTVTELLSRNGTPPVIHKSYKKAPK